MTASPLIIPVARFFTVSGGAGLAGGKVYTYAAGTNTLKDSYTTAAGNVANTNPVILDSSGSAAIWLNGNYKINVLDSNDVQQANYPVDNVSSSGASGAQDYAVTTGSANTYVLTPIPAITSYSAGNSFNIQINASNTGASTINISALGAKNIVTSPSNALIGGELIVGGIYTIIYDGTNFQVFGSPRRPINAQTGTTYTIVAGDTNHLTTFSNASAVAVTLPQANSTTFASGWESTLSNLGVGTVTITPTTSTINGAATYTLVTGQNATITSDGTNYQVSNQGSSYAALTNISNTFSKGQRNSSSSLTSSSNHTAIDLSLNNDYTTTLTENTTLDNPSNIVAGQKGAIQITQHASAAKTVAYGSYFKFPGGNIPSVSATLGAVDILYYDVKSSTFIAANLVKGFA